MKRRTTILSTASVFFIVLTLFSSCGIGIPFNIESSIDDITSESEDAVSANYNVSSDNSTIENLELIKDGTGPSLMLFYTITDSEGRIDFKTAFDAKYRINHNGINISSDEVLTVDGITLYRFSDDQKNHFQAPYYIATANSRTSPEFTCTITNTKTPSIDNEEAMVDMILSFVSGSYTIYYSPILRRFTGDAFETNPAKIRDNSSFPDYHIGIYQLNMFIHIYAAVNVSEGNFYNTYWTELAYLGHIKLNVDKT